MSSPDVLIAGAGIIGLSTALELARHGLRVTVLEQGEPMREASWAAAGMLAAHDPENPPGLRALADLSLRLYPPFLAAVEQFSGLAVPLRTMTTLQGTLRKPSAGNAAVAPAVPQLQSSRYSFAAIEEQSLDPRDLCVALPRAAQAAGVTLIEHAPVERIQLTCEGALVATHNRAYAARYFVLACGAWAGLPRFGAWRLAVEPRKGQMLRVMLPASGPQLPCVLRNPELYLVPRGDRSIVIGATVERTGFDRGIAPAAARYLLSKAAALWPPILHGTIVEQWAGLRPGTPDGLPILDALPCDSPADACVTGFTATGHFRNGILLAPATACLLRQMILSQPLDADLHAFRLARFGDAALQPAAGPHDNALRATL